MMHCQTPQNQTLSCYGESSSATRVWKWCNECMIKETLLKTVVPPGCSLRWFLKPHAFIQVSGSCLNQSCWMWNWPPRTQRLPLQAHLLSIVVFLKKKKKILWHQSESSHHLKWGSVKNIKDKCRKSFKGPRFGGKTSFISTRMTSEQLVWSTVWST